MFLWGSNEDSSPGNSPSGSSEALSEEGGTRAVWMWFYLRGRHDTKHTFWQRVAASHKKVAATHKKQISVNDFSGFLDVRRCNNVGSSDVLLKISIWSLFWQFLPEHQGPRSWSPPWILCRGCGRSAAAVANDWIILESDGEWQFLVSTIKPVLF